MDSGQDDQGYSMLVRALLKKGCEGVNLSAFSDAQKSGISRAASDFFSRGFILESIQAYYMLRDIRALDSIGEECLKMNRNELAFEAFRLAGNKDGLSRAGASFLRNSEIEKARAAFRLAENAEMIMFIEKNLDK